MPLNPALKISSHLSTNLLKIGLVLFSDIQTHFGKASLFSITTCSIQPQSNLGFVLFPNLFPSLNSTPSPKVPLQRNILQSKSNLPTANSYHDFFEAYPNSHPGFMLPPIKTFKSTIIAKSNHKLFPRVYKITLFKLH